MIGRQNDADAAPEGAQTQTALNPNPMKFNAGFSS
jgi:hypothetical protein